MSKGAARPHETLWVLGVPVPAEPRADRAQDAVELELRRASDRREERGSERAARRVREARVREARVREARVREARVRTLVAGKVDGQAAVAAIVYVDGLSWREPLEEPREPRG